VNRTRKQGNNACGAGRRETAGRRFSGKVGKLERSAAGKRENNVCGAGRHETAGRRFSRKAGKFERSGAGK